MGDRGGQGEENSGQPSVQVVGFAIENGDFMVDAPAFGGIPEDGAPTFKVSRFAGPVDTFGVEEIVFFPHAATVEFEMGIVGGGEHVEAVGGGIELAPEEVAFDFFAAGDNHDAAIEGG